MSGPLVSVAPDVPVEGKTLKQLTYNSLKRSLDLFHASAGQPTPADEESQKLKARIKYQDEYAAAEHLKAPTAQPQQGPAALGPLAGAAAGATAGPEGPVQSKTPLGKMLDNMSTAPAAPPAGQALMVYQPDAAARQREVMQVIKDKPQTSAAVSRRMASKWPRPVYHPPWKLYRVLAGHLGWVTCVSVSPDNEWFATGSGDRTIKIWDLASGTLKLTLTGHIETVTGLVVDPILTYMYSCAKDKEIKCWDLEQNKVIRNYHGHLSGVLCLAKHPTLNVLFSGGRDSVCRVWDIRSKSQIFVLEGHQQMVCSLLANDADPQIITGSADHTIKTWDLRTGKNIQTLTHHKKSIRAMCSHPSEFAFLSAGADNIKKWGISTPEDGKPQAEFLHNMLQNQMTIVNSLAMNEDGVIASGGENGSLWFWDYRSGHCFQQEQTRLQSGSMDAEAQILACTFDHSGSRLITCEGDKTVKMWRPEENATSDTHPNLPFYPPKDIKRF